MISEEFKKDIRNNLEKFSDISADTLFPDFDGFIRQNAHDIAYNIPDYKGIAAQAYRRNDYAEAIDTYNSAIRLDPSNANLYISRGNVHREIKQYEKAIMDFNQAININPKIPYSYYWRGRTYQTLEQYKESIADYNIAISIFPDYFYFFYWRGNAKYHLEEYSDAIDDFDKAISLEPANEYFYYWRALTKKKFGKSWRANQDFEMGLLLANQTDNNELINKIEEELSEIEDDIPF